MKYTAHSRTVHQTQKILYTEEVHTEDSVFIIPNLMRIYRERTPVHAPSAQKSDYVHEGGIWRVNRLHVQAAIQCLVEPCVFLNRGPGPARTTQSISVNYPHWEGDDITSTRP